MKYITEYRNKQRVEKLLDAIHAEATGSYHLMEVCGSHTHAIRRHGLQSLLPDQIRLLSGPGCPVCVSDQSYIDKIIALAGYKDMIIATFGDLLRVPGTEKSLQACREEGADIRVVYSPMQALDLAKQYPGRQVIFPAIGFETTAPSSAVTLRQAKSENQNNFSLLSAHKLMPPAMQAVINEGVRLNGYICPGHVSAITGSGIYHVFPEKYKVATVIAGFEPTDILQAVLMLVRQINNRNFKTEIQYIRAVRPEGNPKAKAIMNDVFVRADDSWRGFGNLPNSGLQPGPDYAGWDAGLKFTISTPQKAENGKCICGEILQGKKQPENCSLFASLCTPQNPVGACMVSAEGSCQAHYKYRNYETQN